jgi:hypothetical protein
MTGHDIKNSNLLLGTSLSISSNKPVTNLKKKCATIGNNKKHKTFGSESNETIGN